MHIMASSIVAQVRAMAFYSDNYIIFAELKELIAMHSAHAAHGGDLKMDTVTIIGATLDLQEKVVKQVRAALCATITNHNTSSKAMTPIEDVFMLSIDSRLDYELMKKICETGHSRVPVYEEIDIPGYTSSPAGNERMHRVKRILGILLVKNCVMLDPKGKNKYLNQLHKLSKLRRHTIAQNPLEQSTLRAEQ